MTHVRVSLFGMGYVGLTTAACLADHGFPTICFDTDAAKLKSIQDGRSPFYERGLRELLEKTAGRGLLRCTSDPRQAVMESDLTFITVGTPSRSDGSIDLTQVEDACKSIGHALAKKSQRHSVVIKSTVVPGATENRIKPLLEDYSKKQAGSNFNLCVNPEFLREGSAVEDTVKPDRIVIGEHDRRSGDVLQELYTRFHGSTLPPLLRTTLTNAELIKYANNTFLAMKVSFINMIANLCERLPAANVTEVAEGIGLDKRIGRPFLNAGAGWGGSCFRKDLTALRAYAKSLGIDLPLVDATLQINEDRPSRIVEMAEGLVGNLAGKTVAVLGLAFKPGTDDMRDAVSTKVITKLLDRGAKVAAYDPAAHDTAYAILGEKISYASSAEECLENADCALILTEWEDFTRLTPEDFMRRMKTPCIVDGRRIYLPTQFQGKTKFKALGLGAHEE